MTMLMFSWNKLQQKLKVKINQVSKEEEKDGEAVGEDHHKLNLGKRALKNQFGMKQTYTHLIFLFLLDSLVASP